MTRQYDSVQHTYHLAVYEALRLGTIEETLDALNAHPIAGSRVWDQHELAAYVRKLEYKVWLADRQAVLDAQAGAEAHETKVRHAKGKANTRGEAYAAWRVRNERPPPKEPKPAKRDWRQTPHLRVVPDDKTPDERVGAIDALMRGDKR